MWRGAGHTWASCPGLCGEPAGWELRGRGKAGLQVLTDGSDLIDNQPPNGNLDGALLRLTQGPGSFPSRPHPLLLWSLRSSLRSVVLRPS